MSESGQPPQATLPPPLAEDARTYLAAFLGPAAVEAAMHDLVADAAFFGDETREEVLTDAHLVLEERIDVPEPLAALVLVEDVGLEIGQVAPILALSPTQVAARLDEALVDLGEEPRYERELEEEREPPPAIVIEAERPEPEPVPEPTPTPERRPALLRLAGYGLLAVVVVAVVATVTSALTGPSEPAPSDDGCTTDGLCVTDVYFTDVMRDGEGPGQPREEFTTSDSVWIVVEHRGGDADSRVELRPTREGRLLYPEQRHSLSDGPLAAPFAAWFMQEPGTYRVAVVADGLLLAERTFDVVASETAAGTPTEAPG